MLSLRFPAHHLPILSISTGSKLSLASIQIGHSCAFDGAYVDQHVDAAFVGLDETTALTDVEPPYGSICHSWPSAHQATSSQGHSAGSWTTCGAGHVSTQVLASEPLIEDGGFASRSLDNFMI